MPADPAAPRAIELQPPLGGVVKKYAVQNQPPYTCPLALNVRLGVGSSLRQRIGTRPGLAKHFADQVGSGPMRLLNSVEYIDATTKLRKSMLVASANGVLKHEEADGTLSASIPCLGLIAPTIVISKTQLIHSAKIGQKLYIGDWDPDATISGADRFPKVFDPAGGTLAKITASAGTVPSGNPCVARYRGRLVLAGASANPQLWYMSRVGDPTDWDYSVEAADKSGAVSGGTDDAFTIGEAITALIPSGDECMIFGCSTSLHILQNDPRSGGSIKKISDKVGIVSHGAWCTTPEDAIVFLSHDGLYMMYGGCSHTHPQSLSRERLPAALLNLGQSDKIINLAYNQFARGVDIWVTPTLPPYTTGTIGIVDGVVTLTGGTWPNWAAGAALTVAGNTYTVNTRNSATGLTLTNLTIDVTAGETFSLASTAAASEHYFFDWEDKGFWPQSFPYDQECTAILNWQDFATSPSYSVAFDAVITGQSTGAHTSTAHASVANDSTVLYGSRDGYLRRMKTAQATDDSTAIDSYVVYGPLGSGRGFYNSMLQEIHGTRASGSGNINWSILAGSSPEEALDSADRTASGTWRENAWNPRSYPRITGSDFYVKLEDDAGSVWAIERVGLIMVGQRGMVRR
jgi:hypothetical protein